jgi:hypothetical protein
VFCLLSIAYVVVVQDTRINPAYVLNDRANQMQMEIDSLQQLVEALMVQVQHSQQQPQPTFDMNAVSTHLQTHMFPTNFRAEWVHMLHLMKEIEAHGGIKQLTHTLSQVESNLIPDIDMLVQKISQLEQQMQTNSSNLNEMVHNMTSRNASPSTSLISLDAEVDASKSGANVNGSERRSSRSGQVPTPTPEVTEPEYTSGEDHNDTENDDALGLQKQQPNPQVTSTNSSTGNSFIRPREMTANMHELRSQFQQKHTDLHNKFLELTTSNSKIDTSGFATLTQLDSLNKEIDTMKQILKNTNKGFINRMEILNMLTVSPFTASTLESTKPAVGDPLAVKLRAFILGIIQSIRRLSPFTTQLFSL